MHRTRWRGTTSGDRRKKAASQYMKHVVLALLLQAPLIAGISLWGGSGPLALAEESIVRKGWWGDLNLGAGFLSQSGGGINRDDTKFFMGLDVGYVVHPQILLGIELSGWLLEPIERPPDPGGEGIMQAFLTSRVYPLRESGLFVKLGGGYVSHWYTRAEDPPRKAGWGVTVGGGYDFVVSKSNPVIWFVTPFVTYSVGEAGDLTHHAITAGIGLTFTGNGRQQEPSP